MSVDKTYRALSGSVSEFIFTFMSKSLIAICLSVYQAHGFSLAGATHKRLSHSQTCVGAVVHRGRRCETREGGEVENENISFSRLVIKYDLL